MSGTRIEPVDVRLPDGRRVVGEWVRSDRAANADTGSAIYYLHGSGFALCSPRTHRRLTAWLSRLTGLEAALISREVRDLMATGHVQRRPDPSDGRAGIVVLTPKGRRASEAYRAAADELMAEMLSSWSAADLHALAGHLERVVRDFARPAQATVARVGG